MVILPLPPSLQREGHCQPLPGKGPACIQWAWLSMEKLSQTNGQGQGNRGWGAFYTLLLGMVKGFMGLGHMALLGRQKNACR